MRRRHRVAHEGFEKANGPLPLTIRRIALSVFLLLPAIVISRVAAAQNNAVPSRESAEQQDSAEMPIPRQQSQAFAAAVAMIQNREYTHAEKALRDDLLAHPDAAETHFLLGYALYREGKADASLSEYTTGARFQKPQASDLAVVAMDYIVLHDYADADRWLTRAVAWEPENPLYWYYLGRTKYVENRFQEAIAAFGKSLERHPRDVKAEYNLGLAYAGIGQNENAAAAYQNAIAWQKGSPHPDAQPYLDLGILQLDQGHAAEAVDNLQAALSIDQQNPRVHQELGQAYEQMNRLTSAQAELEAAIALIPKVPSLHFELGRIYQKQGLRAKAQEQFARCAALNANHSSDSAETPNADVHP
jgi:Flp pilus assembly protein TadD